MNDPQLRRARWRAFTAAAVVVSLMSACADKKSAPPGNPNAAPKAPEAHGPSAAVPAILDFTAPKLGGGQVVGSELAGKDVVVWFWAPW